MFNKISILLTLNVFIYFEMFLPLKAICEVFLTIRNNKSVFFNFASTYNEKFRAVVGGQ